MGFRSPHSIGAYLTLIKGEQMKANHGPYNATVERVIDGDNVLLHIKLGFQVTVKHSIRLAGINAPELFTGEFKEAGLAAKWHLEGLLPVGTNVVVWTDKDRMSFNRYVGWVVLPDGRDVGEIMVEDEYAVKVK